MASLQKIASEQADIIREGIAWVIIYKTGRSWNAQEVWLNLDDDSFEPEDLDIAKAILEIDPNAIMINGYHCGCFGSEMTITEIAIGIRSVYENHSFQLKDSAEIAKTKEIRPEAMEELKVIKNADINGILCDFYSNGQGEFFMTRQQIGQALGYDNPIDAIYRIHERHKERLDKFSVIDKLTGTDNKKYETYLYSAKGVYEICRWSRQPKADEFYDKVYDILEGLRLGYVSLNAQHQSAHWQQTRLESKNNRRMETDEINQFVAYAFAHGSQNAKKYYINFSQLADRVVGIDSSSRDKATASQLNNLILIEHIIGEVIKDGIQQELPYKDIYRTCKARLGQFKAIAYIN